MEFRRWNFWMNNQKYVLKEYPDGRLGEIIRWSFWRNWQNELLEYIEGFAGEISRINNSCTKKLKGYEKNKWWLSWWFDYPERNLFPSLWICESELFFNTEICKKKCILLIVICPTTLLLFSTPCFLNECWVPGYHIRVKNNSIAALRTQSKAFKTSIFHSSTSTNDHRIRCLHFLVIMLPGIIKKIKIKKHHKQRIGSLLWIWWK